MRGKGKPEPFRPRQPAGYFYFMDSFEDTIELIDQYYEDCKNKIYANDSNSVNPLQEIRNLCASAFQEIERQKEIICIISEQVPKGSFPSSSDLMRGSLEMAKRLVNNAIDEQLKIIK